MHTPRYRRRHDGPPTSGRRGGRAGPLLVATALLLGGCGDAGDDPGPTLAPAPGTSAPTSDAPPAPPGSAEAGATSEPGTGDPDHAFDRLDAGRHTGLLVQLSDGELAGQQVAVVGFDKVDFLTGAEAVDAAREAGVIGPDEVGVPNDYFVRNDNPLVRRLPVRPGAEVLVLDGGSPRLVAGDLDQAVAADSLFELEVVDEHGASVVIGLRAVYVP